MRFIVFNFFLFFLFSFVTSQTSYAAKHCGEVTHASGKVEVLRANTGQDLNRIAIRISPPYKVLCTDILVTQAGSRAKLKLPNGLITLSPNSRISISKVIKGTQNPSLLNLTYGKIRAFFDGDKARAEAKDNKASQTEFRVRTPTAVVGVRGTDFFVGYNPNKELTTQATLKGEVEVEQIKTQAKAIVKGGEQVKVPAIENVPPVEAVKVNPPKLEVKPIGKEIIVQIRQTSPLVKEDVEFTSKEAVAILGTPEKWIPPKDEIPGDLKNIENKF